MFIVVDKKEEKGKTLYRVLDEDDEVLEWHTKSSLYKATKLGFTIQGVTLSGNSIKIRVISKNNIASLFSKLCLLCSDFRFELDGVDIWLTVCNVKSDKVIVPEGVTKLYASCFESLDIDTLYLPTTLVDIHEDAFKSCNIKNIVFAEGTTTIHLNSDILSWGSVNFYIPDSVKRIEEPISDGSVEKSCEGIFLPKNLIYLCDSAFSYLSIEGTITIPGSLKRLSNNCFLESSVEKVVIEEGIEILGEAAFCGCTLEDIELPSSLRVIEDDCFSVCYLGFISIPEGVEILGRTVFESSYFSDIELPSTLRKIGYGCFADCKDLTRLEIPEGFTDLTEFIFGVDDNEIGLEEICLPSTLEKLNCNIFECCSDLDKIIVSNKKVYNLCIDSGVDDSLLELNLI